MCPKEDIFELLGRQQRGNLGNRTSESKGTAGNVCCDAGSMAETSSSIKEIEPIPVKITIHTKKESIIVKTEEDQRKPWYFTHV